MQLSNNLCSHSGRRIGAVEQTLLPMQLNKAEGTAPFIRSHFAPIHTPSFFPSFCPVLGLSLCNLRTLPEIQAFGDELPGSPRQTQDLCSLSFPCSYKFTRLFHASITHSCLPPYTCAVTYTHIPSQAGVGAPSHKLMCAVVSSYAHFAPLRFPHVWPFLQPPCFPGSTIILLW